MKNSQFFYSQLNKKLDLIKIELQKQIQMENGKQALQQYLHDSYGTEVSDLKEKIDAVKLELQEELKAVKKEVDALQIKFMKPKIWYKDASVVIALLAVVFSLGTAMASYFQVDSQNRRASRAELRGLIQRLIALPREEAENLKIYKDNPVTLNNLSSNTNQEYILLASQAVELANRIPNDISATEYGSVAQALISRGITEQVPVLLDAGLKVSRDINNELFLLRNYGNYYFIIGDVNAGRQKYQKSIQRFLLP